MGGVVVDSKLSLTRPRRSLNARFRAWRENQENQIFPLRL